MKYPKLIIFILFTLIAAAIYYNSFPNGFYLDDIHHVVGNSYLKSLSNIPLFFTDPRTFSRAGLGHYRPLLLVTYSLNYAAGGLKPAGYHIVNLAFHIGSAFLLFLIVEAMLVPIISSPTLWGEDRRGGRFFAALAAGLIFLANPFNSEVVNYISTRSNVMCAFFYLLAFWYWVKYREGAECTPTLSLPHQGGGKKGGGTFFYIASLLAFLLAMLTKEIAVTLPAVLFLYDQYFISKKGSINYRQYLQYLPFIFITFLSLILPRIIFFGGVIGSAAERGVWTHIPTAAKVLVKYMYSMLLPVNLNVLHHMSEPDSILEAGVLLSLVVLVITFVVAYLLWRRKDRIPRVLSFFILWFFLSLAVVVSAHLSLLYEESRGYLASAGYSAIAGIILWACVSYSGFRAKGRRWLSLVLLLIILSIYSPLVVARNRVWRDAHSLWTDSIQKSPSSFFAHLELAEYYAKTGRIKEAEEELTTTLRLNRHYFVAYGLLGSIYAQRGEFDKAKEMLKRSIELSPFNPYSYRRLVRIYLEEGSLDQARDEVIRLLNIVPTDLEAIRWMVDIFRRKGELHIAKENYTRLLDKDPRNPALHYGLGLIYQEEGQIDKAIDKYHQVLRYIPDDVEVFLNLASAYIIRGNHGLAEETLGKAALFGPDNLTVRLASGNYFHKVKRYDRAIEEYKILLNLEPRSFKAYNNLGLVYHDMGEGDKAIEQFHKALEINPLYLRARINLAWVYESQGKKDLAIKEYESVLHSDHMDKKDEWSYAEARKRLAVLAK